MRPVQKDKAVVTVWTTALVEIFHLHLGSGEGWNLFVISESNEESSELNTARETQSFA